MDIFEWDENIPVTANNLNEMQNIINQNIIDKYSTEEAETNKVWIDDKPIYRKVYTLNSLPNTSSLNIDVSTLNISTIITLTGYSNTGLVFNGNRTGSVNSQIDLFADLSQNRITLTANSDRSNMSGFIIIEYTKI